MCKWNKTLSHSVLIITKMPGAEVVSQVSKVEMGSEALSHEHTRIAEEEQRSSSGVSYDCGF